MIGSGGVLYGTTYNGGHSQEGTVLVLHSFSGEINDGFQPIGGVVIGSGGVLYCATHVGLFSLTTPASPGGAWTEEVI